jgi:tripartite-type tricarboxylate transporter receptor subunit TctC
MRMRRLAITFLTLSAALLAQFNNGVWSRTTKTIKIVVPAAPGGPRGHFSSLIG